MGGCVLALRFDMPASIACPSCHESLPLFSCAKTTAPIPVSSLLCQQALILAALDPNVLSIEPAPPIALATLDGAVTGLTAIFTDQNGSKTAVVADDGDAFAAMFADDARAATERMKLGFKILTADEIRLEPLLTNSELVWSCRNRFIPASDQVRILLHLSEYGAVPLIEASYAAVNSRDGISTVLALACRNLVELNLAEDPLGPDTKVRRRNIA